MQLEKNCIFVTSAKCAENRQSAIVYGITVLERERIAKYYSQTSIDIGSSIEGCLQAVLKFPTADFRRFVFAISRAPIANKVKSWPAALVGTRPAEGRNLFNCKQGSTIHMQPFIVSLSFS